MFFQRPIHSKIWCSHLHNTCTFT